MRVHKKEQISSEMRIQVRFKWIREECSDDSLKENPGDTGLGMKPISIMHQLSNRKPNV